MVFLRAVTDKRRDSPANSELYNSTSNIFTRDLISRLSAVLIADFFPINAMDMQTWETDPETLVNEELRCAWRENKRVCKSIFVSAFLSALISHVPKCFLEAYFDIILPLYAQ
jgi:hypothetical protein